MEYNQEKEVLNNIDTIINILENVNKSLLNTKSLILGDVETKKPLSELSLYEMDLKGQTLTIRKLLRTYNLDKRLKKEGANNTYIEDLTNLITSRGLDVKDLKETFKAIEYINNKGKVGYLRGYIINSIKNINV